VYGQRTPAGALRSAAATAPLAASVRLLLLLLLLPVTQLADAPRWLARAFDRTPGIDMRVMKSSCV